VKVHGSSPPRKRWGTSFNRQLPKQFLGRLPSKTQPYTKRIAHKGIWVEPQLNAEIEYRAKSDEGKVRHPFFRGLREDLKCSGATVARTAAGSARTTPTCRGSVREPAAAKVQEPGVTDPADHSHTR
jgi:hypothetical protein